MKRQDHRATTRPRTSLNTESSAEIRAPPCLRNQNLGRSSTTTGTRAKRSPKFVPLYPKRSSRSNEPTFEERFESVRWLLPIDRHWTVLWLDCRYQHPEYVSPRLYSGIPYKHLVNGPGVGMVVLSDDITPSRNQDRVEESRNSPQGEARKPRSESAVGTQKAPFSTDFRAPCSTERRAGVACV